MVPTGSCWLWEARAGVRLRGSLWTSKRQRAEGTQGTREPQNLVTGGACWGGRAMCTLAPTPPGAPDFALSLLRLEKRCSLGP